MEPRITVLTGHFGSGKTEIAINLAIEEREKFKKVAINDLDVINPYFRTREVEKVLLEHNVELIAPRGYLATADLPVVSGEFYRVLHDPRYRVIVDAGGDKDGATALGQYYDEWKDMQVELIFVLNAKRPYVSSLDGAIFTIEEIERVSRLKLSGIINNTNVGPATTNDDLQLGLELGKTISKKLKVPLLYTTIDKKFMPIVYDFAKNNHVKCIERYMKLPWER